MMNGIMMINDHCHFDGNDIHCIPDPLLLFVDVDDVLVGRVRLRERVKLVHLLDVPEQKDKEDEKEDV